MTKITDLTALTAALLATGDYLPVIDKSGVDTALKNKKITAANLMTPKFYPLTTPLTNTSWDGDLKSTITVTPLNVNTIFGVPTGSKAVEMRVVCYDTGTHPVSASCTFLIGPTATYYYAISVNPRGGSYRATSQGAVAVVSDIVYYRITASGTGTLSVDLQILGYWL